MAEEEKQLVILMVDSGWEWEWDLDSESEWEWETAAMGWTRRIVSARLLILNQLHLHPPPPPPPPPHLSYVI